jgi:hypothetical protein
MFTVWMDSWQMQCCGKPFSLGSVAAWTLRPASDSDFATAVLGDELASTVTHDEEHHGGLPDDAPVTHAIVCSIRAIWCEYGPTPGREPKALYPIAGSCVIADKTSADGWEAESAGLKFVSYLIEVEPTEGE